MDILIEKKGEIISKNKEFTNTFNINNISKKNNIDNIEDGYISKKTHVISNITLGKAEYDFGLVSKNIYFNLLYEVLFNISDTSRILDSYEAILRLEKANNMTQYNVF